jgi:Serine dehydrogenase proteinase
MIELNERVAHEFRDILPDEMFQTVEKLFRSSRLPASVVKARDSKPAENVFDLTLVLADMGEKALAQVRRGAIELLTPRMEQAAAEALAGKLAGGNWTHD